MTLQQNKINHVAFVIDRSGSMRGRENDVIKVVDNQVAFLAQLSKDLDQETRVTIYLFDDRVDCIVFDKDVLRLPSIKDFYFVRGQTALRDATIQSQMELAQTCQLYGDHAFLTFVFTDGHENDSMNSSAQLYGLLSTQKDNWTVGVLVPDFNGRLAAEGAGFAKGNISIWDVNSSTGVEEAGTDIQAATQSYMTSRASGIRGTKQLFSTDPNAVNASTIKAAGLKPLDPKLYTLTAVTAPKESKNEGVLNKDKHRVWEIQQYVEKLNGPGSFRVGKAFYELSKKEKISGTKDLAVLEVATSKVFVGNGVRAMIGLPDADKTVAPDFNPDYKIFVQSQSHNRHLVVGKKLLVLR